MMFQHSRLSVELATNITLTSGIAIGSLAKVLKMPGSRHFGTVNDK